jgi:hypothetical protein
VHDKRADRPGGLQSLAKGANICRKRTNKALSDRILVSWQGKVVEEFSALEATEEKIMYAAVH